MNFKLTMSLVVILLIAAIVFMLVPQDKPPVTQASETTPLLVKKPESIKSVTYLRDSVVQVKFDKDGDNWTMTQPVKAAVDSMTVGNIASSLLNASYRRKFAPEGTGDKSPESTGTAKPRNTIKFTDNTGKDYTLALGYRSNDGTFATLNGDKTIYVLESTPLAMLDKDPQDFRNKQIKKIDDTSKIVKLNIKTTQTVDGKVSQNEVTLAKTDGKWLITAPVSARANTTAVEDIVRELGNVQALTFSTLDKKIAGTDPGMADVTAWIEEAAAPAPATASAPATTTAAAQTKPAPKLTAVTLQLGYYSNALNRDTSSVYASLADSNDVFTYSREAFNKMNKELKDLRDTAVVPATVRQATEFTLATDGSASVAASSSNNNWTLAATPKPLAGDASAISEYLGVIGDLRAIKFVDNAGDLKSLALDPPHMKIDLVIPGQSQHEVLLVGKPQDALEGGKVTPVMRQGEPTVYLLQSTDAAKLATTPVALRSREIERLESDKIRKIEITGTRATVGITATPPATSTAPATSPVTMAATQPLLPGVTLERDGTKWNVKKSADTLPADDSKLTSLLADFSPLNTNRYIDDMPPTGTPDITVAVTVLESAFTPATATAPATGSATASAPAAATSTSPAPTLADVLPANRVAGPDAGKLVIHTLRLYRQEAPASAPTTTTTAPATQPTVTWKAVWDTQSPAWTFEPNSFLVDHVSKETYNPTVATAPAPTTSTKP